MVVLDSRRVTGPHLLTHGPGAAVEVRLEPGDAVGDWLARAEGLCRVLGWDFEAGGRTWADATGAPCASLALRAPADLLETACLVAEAATRSGHADLGAIGSARVSEANPRLRALAAQAEAASLPHFWDDEGFTVGYGAHARTWPLNDLPRALPDAGRVPVALVTGTNGKTTTTRLIARMALEAGLRAGHTSSDAIVVGRAVVDRGDWSGPGAARRLLRDPQVELAVLETARGGLLRRGVAIRDADVAVVTNVSDDHFGEYGLVDLAGMAEAKLSIVGGLRFGGRLIVNAADDALVGALERVSGRRPDLQITRFDARTVATHLHVGDEVVPLDEIPITLGGLARYNVENVVAAVAVAEALGVPAPAIARALREFRPDTADSSGRTNVFHRCPAAGGADVILDFAHNPDGVARLGPVVRGWDARKRILALSAAGDRTDAVLDRLAAVAAALGCDAYICKDLPDHHRGRAPMEVPQRLRAGLIAAGIAPGAIHLAPDDASGARIALDLASAGDLVILLVHEQFETVRAWLEGGNAPSPG